MNHVVVFVTEKETIQVSLQQQVNNNTIWKHHGGVTVTVKYIHLNVTGSS